MVLQTSGQITFSDVNTELQRSSTAQLSMGDTDFRLLAGKPTGSFSMNDLYGKSYIFNATISSNQQELNLAIWAQSNGWNGVFPAVITVNPGVYIWSDSTSIAGLTTGVFPRGLIIINNGFIMGRGGNGGVGAGTRENGYNGGNAILLNSNTIIQHNASGYIGGGGGGGAGGSQGAGGGGAGGGTGGYSYYKGTQIGGAGGIVGNIGSNGTEYWTGDGYYGRGGGAGGSGGNGKSNKGSDDVGAGGGGGRIFPGIGGVGGGSAGGSANNVGSNGGGRTGAGGGGWGVNGGSSDTYIGGSGGKAISLNGYSCTLTGVTNQIYGVIS